MFSTMCCHFSEVPLRNGPFPLLTAFVEAVVKFINWGHFKVLTHFSSRYFRLRRAGFGKKIEQVLKEVMQKKKFHLFHCNLQNR